MVRCSRRCALLDADTSTPLTGWARCASTAAAMMCTRGVGGLSKPAFLMWLLEYICVPLCAMAHLAEADLCVSVTLSLIQVASTADARYAYGVEGRTVARVRTPEAEASYLPAFYALFTPPLRRKGRAVKPYDALQYRNPPRFYFYRNMLQSNA